jgi:hypothetical protein
MANLLNKAEKLIISFCLNGTKNISYVIIYLTITKELIRTGYEIKSSEQIKDDISFRDEAIELLKDVNDSLFRNTSTPLKLGFTTFSILNEDIPKDEINDIIVGNFIFETIKSENIKKDKEDDKKKEKKSVYTSMKYIE